MILVDEESALKDSEPERKRKKIEDSLGKSVVPDVPEGKNKHDIFPSPYEIKVQNRSKRSVV